MSSDGIYDRNASTLFFTELVRGKHPSLEIALNLRKKTHSMFYLTPVFKIMRLSPKVVKVDMQVLGQTKTQCIYT